MTKEELQRYSRHILLPEIGIHGQQTLAHARVLIVGIGGLGSPAALYLAAAGVGTLGLIDPDTVDRSNLQRQVLYGESNVGTSKVESAATRLRDLNPLVEVEIFSERLTKENALEIISQYDVVLDGTDNFETRYLVNDACVLTRTPNVFASIDQFSGQLSIFGSSSGPCYRCMYPEPPAAGTVLSCGEAGVLGVLPGVMGMLQATECLKLLLSIGEPLVGRILRYDALSMSFTEIKLKRDPSCPACGKEPSIRSLQDVDYLAYCAVEESVPEVTSNEFESSPHRWFLLDVREAEEYAADNLGGVLIPLGELADRLNELPLDREILVHCKSGVRSRKAVRILHQAGFINSRSLQGGIEAVRRAALP